MSTKVFKLTNFSPVGFKQPNYPCAYCSLCRGYLIEVCDNCLQSKCEVCDVVQKDDVYYHNHCWTFMNNQSDDKTKGKKK